jgi:LmeA-like phospholipid-binding
VAREYADAGEYAEQGRPRRRTGRRLLTVLLVLLVLALIVLVVVDRASAAYVEREIARRVSSEVVSQGLKASPPEVTVAGVPFLTQVLAGRYKEIRILMRDVTGAAAAGRTVRMPVLDIRVRDVRASLQTVRTGQGDITAGTVAGASTIDYASVAELIGREGVLLSERDGRLAVTAPLDVAGQRLTLRGTADLSVGDGTVRIRFRDLTADGIADVPFAQNLINAYARQISIDIDVPDLPLGLVLREVRPRPEGLLFATAAANVPLKRAQR